METSQRPGLLAEARGLSAATLYEAAGQSGDIAPHIRPLAGTTAIAGYARTLRVFPGDNRGVFEAIERSGPHDVLVIDAGGTDRVTVWGGTSTRAAQARGLAGCITNGAVRDVAEIRELAFPVYAAGVSVRGAAKRHPGWHDQPVCVGDVTVHAGDLVVGDEDGVVVIPSSRMAAVLAAARELQAQHEARDRQVAAGALLGHALRLRQED